MTTPLMASPSNIVSYLLTNVVMRMSVQHEDTSVAMFEHLIQENGLRKDFQEYHLNERDIQFIKEQIGGAKHRTTGVYYVTFHSNVWL